MLVELLDRILAREQELDAYTAEYYVSPSNSGGSPNADGTWSGVVGELVTGNADVALFPLTRTAARLNVSDATFSYMDAGMAVLTATVTQDAGSLSVLAPFTLSLWLVLMATVITVAILFFALGKYSMWLRRKQTDKLRASGEISQKAMLGHKEPAGGTVMITFAAAAGAPERPGINSWAVQVLYIGYCFFCLVVLSAYTANLTSYLSVQSVDVTIEGLKTLLRNGGMLGLNPNGSTAAYFTDSQDTLVMQLQSQLSFCDTQSCIAGVRAGSLAAFVSDKPLLDFQAGLQPCDLEVVGQDFGPGNLVFGLQKNSSLLEPFNRAIQHFLEDGTLTTMRRAWFDNLSQCQSGGATLDNDKLGLPELLGAFVFLAMFVVLSFAVGTCENLKVCVLHAYRAEKGIPDSESSRPFTRLWHRIRRYGRRDDGGTERGSDGGSGKLPPLSPGARLPDDCSELHEGSGSSRHRGSDSGVRRSNGHNPAAAASTSRKAGSSMLLYSNGAFDAGSNGHGYAARRYDGAGGVGDSGAGLTSRPSGEAPRRGRSGRTALPDSVAASLADGGLSPGLEREAAGRASDGEEEAQAVKGDVEEGSRGGRGAGHASWGQARGGRAGPATAPAPVEWDSSAGPSGRSQLPPLPPLPAVMRMPGSGAQGRQGSRNRPSAETEHQPEPQPEAEPGQGPGPEPRPGLDPAPSPMQSSAPEPSWNRAPSHGSLVARPSGKGGSKGASAPWPLRGVAPPPPVDEEPKSRNPTPRTPILPSQSDIITPRQPPRVESVGVTRGGGDAGVRFGNGEAGAVQSGGDVGTQGKERRRGARQGKPGASGKGADDEPWETHPLR
ncbi:hypothetical protein HYH03_004814 [Edaphochlamys debaryana]|uniref:Ionotropic glutamate receptor C-terminal domain-containing protein n=1 Tax=Edaphochlamys debaryana TaxID=47281 RepID=A0A835YEB4_9CHLO|nr:hypothetical protein HYH03_004814 [Edaphochlamys debaryana]|eukprot:KAG2497225.1 hypothetical protein HYH03_004814 [Edaphochlamys debaryana]